MLFCGSQVIKRMPSIKCILGQIPDSLRPWIGLHGYGWVGVTKGNIVKAFTFFPFTTLFWTRQKRKKIKEKPYVDKKKNPVQMEGCRDFQGVGIKGGNWSTSEGKSERSGWMRRQHENCCFCLYSWLVKRRLTLQPELGLHKSKACKQDYLSVSTSVYTHTHTHTVHSSIHQKILKGKVT